MQAVSDYPYEVEELEHVWIPLEDGTRLAARVWLPKGAREKPVPAILEYLPYRRRDGTRARDATHHPYLAGHGYAAVRVDMRGSGDSDGILHDEYLKQEQDDGLEILSWIAQQPWCDGNLGMIGISWGGFNGLQIAARKPKELKAIITICSTDDRYADDVHYMGGNLLLDNLAWASTMFAYNYRPPDPETTGGEWRDKWLERLEKSRFWLEPWLEHQTRDEYWKHGSVAQDFSAIECPVFAVGGWADAYSNAIPRLLAGLDVPRLGLIGPWGHRYPHMGVPGPAMDFLGESLRWWDKWLKGKETGIMDEPQLRAYIQESAPPQTQYVERPGRFVAEPAWPSANIRATPFRLGNGTLAAGETTPGEHVVTIDSPIGAGLQSGAWCSYGEDGDLPGDQRIDDAHSVIFETEPLTERLEILGAPVAELELESDKPLAQVAVRLSDVRPDGSVTRVSYGMLNLAHRESHEHPEPLEPGRRYTVRVQLNDIGQAFPAGHRIRLSISNNYWPIAWPSPQPTRLRLHTAGSKLLLPVRPDGAEDAQVLMPAVGAPPLEVTRLSDGESTRRIHRDLPTDSTTVEVVDDSGRFIIDEIDLEVTSKSVERYSVRGGDHYSPKGEVEWEIAYRRGPWKTRIVTYTSLTATETSFLTYGRVQAYEGDELVFERTHENSFDRNHV